MTTVTFTLPVEGKQRARQATYAEDTETLAIATLNADLSLDVELYLVTFAAGVAYVGQYEVNGDKCTCGGFKARQRCKHAQSIREIKRRQAVERATLDAGIDEDRMQWQADQAEQNDHKPYNFSRAEGEW